MVILYELQQTNANRFHITSYSVGDNQKNFFHHKNNNDNNKKRNNPHLQTEVIK